MATNARTYDPGQNLYLLIWDENNQIWDVAAAEFEVYAAGSYDDYDLAATEKGSCGYYFVTTPALTAGWYRLDWRVRAAASPAESDPAIALESSYFDGTRWYAVWGIQGTKNQLDDLTDASGGDATADNQMTIISHLTDIKGATWSESTDTLEGVYDATVGGNSPNIEIDIDEITVS